MLMKPLRNFSAHRAAQRVCSRLLFPRQRRMLNCRLSACWKVQDISMELHWFCSLGTFPAKRHNWEHLSC